MEMHCIFTIPLYFTRKIPIMVKKEFSQSFSIKIICEKSTHFKCDENNIFFNNYLEIFYSLYMNFSII